jgi:hypothetical protein
MVNALDYTFLVYTRHPGLGFTNVDKYLLSSGFNRYVKSGVNGSPTGSVSDLTRTFLNLSGPLGTCQFDKSC